MTCARTTVLWMAMMLVPADVLAQSYSEPLPAEQVPSAPPSYAPASTAYVPPTPMTMPQPAPIARARGGYMPTWGLFIPGAAAFVVTYGSAVLAAIDVDMHYGSSEASTWLYVPCVGPFVLVGMAEGDTDAQILFAVLGVAQTAGLGMAIAGLAWNSRAEEDDLALGWTPIVSPTFAGAGVQGRF